MDSMGGILTKGLGGTACIHLIMGPFRLHCGDVPHTPSNPSGGGFNIRADSKAAQIIQERRREQSEDTDLIKPKKQITITFEFNDTVHEKQIIVDANKADKIVKAVDWINKTKQSLQIMFDNFTKKE